MPDIIDLIDGAIRASEVSKDAMRWAPSRTDGGGWEPIGYVESMSFGPQDVTGSWLGSTDGRRVPIMGNDVASWCSAHVDRVNPYALTAWQAEVIRNFFGDLARAVTEVFAGVGQAVIEFTVQANRLLRKLGPLAVAINRQQKRTARGIRKREARELAAVRAQIARTMRTQKQARYDARSGVRRMHTQYAARRR